MGTIVSIEVVAPADGARDDSDSADALDRAFRWFHHVEATCSRFDGESELMQLVARPGAPVPVSPLLFRAVEFALAMAEETGGAFDPTIGLALEARGFTRHYLTGATSRTAIRRQGDVSHRDVRLDVARQTITLERPLVLDLGAVAKGLAVDLAARELQPLRNYAIDAGGDLYLAGCNRKGEPWSIGIRHPRADGEVIDVVRVSGTAVCTSGDYERRGADASGHHILDPRTGDSAGALASVTVIAPSAMVADALGTAVFVLGPAEGLRLLERHGAEGLLITPALERIETTGMRALSARA
jgi:thiamine biosynthesis lipoprotein